MHSRLGRLLRLAGVAAWRATLSSINSDHLTYAASIAYWTLLSLIPFFLLVLAAIGQMSGDPESRRAVLDFALQYFPGRFDVIRAELDAASASPVSLGLAGSAFMIWSALGVFGAVTTAVNYAWGVETPRGFWQHRLFSLLMLIVAAVLLSAGLMLVTASKIIGSNWFAGVLHNFPGLSRFEGFAFETASRGILIGVIGLVFYFVPNARVRLRDVWLGAVITGVIWIGTLEGLTWFFANARRYPIVSGSMAVIAAFLFWVYVQAVILLFGVRFTAAYARLRSAEDQRHATAPAPAPH